MANNDNDTLEAFAQAQEGTQPSLPDSSLTKQLLQANMSPEDKQDIIDAYEKQFGTLGTGAGVTSPQGNTQASPQTTPAAALSSPPATASGGTPNALSGLMGRLNLGDIPRGTDSPSVQDILSKINGQTNPALQAALASRNQMQLFSLLGKASNQILGGQTHTRPSDAVFDELGKQADQGVQNINTKNALIEQGLKQQQQASAMADAQSKDDPNSSISTLYRAAVEKMLHAKLPDNISATQLDKVSPVFEKLYVGEQNALDRQARMQEMNSFRQQSLDARTENQANTSYDKNTLQFANRIEGSNRINKILGDIKSGRLIDTPSVYNALNSEIAQLFTNVQSGGALTDREESRIHSLQGLMAKSSAWVGKPMSAIPPDFLPQIERETNALKSEYLDAYKRKSQELQAGTSFQNKKDVYNNRTNAFFKNQGIDPNTLQQGHPQDNEAISWAKNPNSPGWSKEKAAAILKANGLAQ